MEDLLIEILESFGFPVVKQGSMNEDVGFPDDFFTYFERPSYDGSHYDNDAVSCVYEYDVNFYSVNPANPYKYIKEAKKKLKENECILSGNGGDVRSGTPTHTGRGIEAIFIEREVA